MDYTFLGFTLFWLFFGGVLPWFVPKGPNRGLIRMSIALTGFTCWMFWACIYLSQINPLLGPKLTNRTALMILKEWEHKFIRVNGTKDYGTYGQ